MQQPISLRTFLPLKPLFLLVLERDGEIQDDDDEWTETSAKWKDYTRKGEVSSLVISLNLLWILDVPNWAILFCFEFLNYFARVVFFLIPKLFFQSTKLYVQNENKLLEMIRYISMAYNPTS